MKRKWSWERERDEAAWKTSNDGLPLNAPVGTSSHINIYKSHRMFQMLCDVFDVVEFASVSWETSVKRWKVWHCSSCIEMMCYKPPILWDVYLTLPMHNSCCHSYSRSDLLFVFAVVFHSLFFIKSSLFLNVRIIGDNEGQKCTSVTTWWPLIMGVIHIF